MKARSIRRFAVLPVLAMMAGLTFPAAAAEFDAAKYFSGKTINIVVGSAAGGSFDRTARIVAKVLGKHFPGNPRVVVQNRPGGGGRVALRHVMLEKPDGLSVNTVNTVRFIAPWFAGKKMEEFDPTKAKWVGMPVYDDLPNAIYCRKDVAKNWDEAKKLGRKLRVPAEAPTSAGRGSVGPVMVELANGPMETIYGYDGGAAEYLAAIDRGEVDCSSSANERNTPRRMPEWMKKKFIAPLFWYGAPPDEAYLKALDAPMPPNIKEVVEAPEARWQAFEATMEFHKTSRAFVMHPDTPPGIYEAWKAGFKAATQSPEYVKLMDAAGDVGKYGPPEAITEAIKVVQGLNEDALKAFLRLTGQVEK